MEELRRELSDGSELIWSSVSEYYHRWCPDKAVLLDARDEESHSFKTHVEMFAAENGSIVLRRTGGVFGRIEYWVHSPGSVGALGNLLERERAGALDKRGSELLDKYALNLELA